MSAPVWEDVPNRTLITISVMLATILQSLDTTIANVALPHMQGSLQAAQDQITWVLTSYIIAVALGTPLAPWLSQKFGRKAVLLTSVVGFTTASVLCGLSQNLAEMVGFRFLQGLFGAALVPLSQAVLLDINPPHMLGRAMSTYSMGVVLGPIVGPALGGYLTDNYSWRWVFLINLPGGILAFIGTYLFLKDQKRAAPQRFDFFGFITLALAIGALQVMLDRGAGKDWFQSTEIWTETVLALVALYLFIIHTVTAERPFFDRALARDRNFVAACAANFFIMMMLFSVLALIPPMLESLMGYPVLTTGLVTMPRGIGMFIVMPIVGRLMGKVDSRYLIGLGLIVNAGALYYMSRLSLQMDAGPLIWSGFVQGIGMSVLFVPMAAAAFATLPPKLRNEGSAIFNLVRNIGSAVGISIMQALFVSDSFKVRANLLENLRPDNPAAQHLTAPLSLATSVGQASLYGLASRQAAMVAYLGNFRLMAVVTLLILPLLLFLRQPKGVQPKPDVHLE